MNKLTFSLILLTMFALMSCKNEGDKNEMKSGVVEMSGDTLKLTELWRSDTLLTTSESVIYDEARSVFYVSCINGVSPWVHDGDGFIAKMDMDGKILERKWIEGISGPKGMGIDGDFLYLTDINQVVKIDIPKGEIVERIPIEGAVNVNDLTVAHDGDVFVSDSKISAIYKITGGKVTQMLHDTTLHGINGLYMKDDTLFFATYNDGMVYRIQHGDLTPRELVSLPSGGDGVELYKDGFIISSWEGRLYQVNKDWTFIELMNTTDQKINSADIEVIEEKNLLLIPTFFDNRVVAYKIRF